MNVNQERVSRVDGEQRLTERARGGDLSALAELLSDNYPFLVKYLIKVTLHPQLAEDIAQETMLRALEKIKLYNERSKFSTWLIAIATRIFIDNRRRSMKERSILEEEVREQQAGRSLRFRLASQGGEWSEVLDALGQLSDDLRLAVVLKHYYGYSQKEIADIMGIPEGTVKSRIHSGLQALRKELTDHDLEAYQESPKRQGKSLAAVHTYE
ncbi:MAG: RNA polymerase sigma factor SigY [Gorillibacterium sp.]|nr:RNA polymerase sigma factor SigY [Gorillibacterium sp.]